MALDRGERSRRQVGIWRTVALLLGILAIGLAIGVIVLATKEGCTGTDHRMCGENSQAESAQVTSADYDVDRSEPNNPGPFHDLTKHEIRKLRTFLETDPDIKSSPPETASMNSSMIYTMDLFLANKAAVLNFLDGTGTQPDRQARVLMFRGDVDPPMVYEYICGPLPDVTSCKLLNNPKRRNPVEFSLRPVGLMEFEAVYEYVLAEVDRKVGYILRESYGTRYTQCKPADCFTMYPGPVGTNLAGDITHRRMWARAEYPLEYYALNPVDFAVLAVLDGSDPSSFTTDKVWYHGKLYDSLDDLIQFYNSSSPEERSHLRPRANNRQLFSSLNNRGEPQPEKSKRPPTLVEPDGRRYSLKDRKVEYMGWSFHFRMSALTGPSLYDIRYKGERIAYELGLAEIAVYYSAIAPAQQMTDFVDSGALIGTHSKSLVPGADCPETATFINQTFAGQAVSEPVELARSFCLFENNNGYPLRRHLSYSQAEGAFYGGMMDSALVLRSALTIVNYDYISDFIFHQNGVIETRVMSTGYILPNFYTQLEDPYGFEIEKNLIGNIHHHLFNFKADLDISGTSNRYETLDIVPDQVTLKTRPDVTYNQVKYVRNLKTSEMDALYKFNFDKPRYHVVHNEDKKTKHGALKSYRVALNGMSKQLLPENENNEGTIPWARHQLVVTKHKDEEVVSSSPYAMWDSLNPVTDFTTFYNDNESIVDEDLVFWITQGMHHIPHTEDLPLTPTVGNHLTFFLLPYNYFDECPSVGSRDHIRIEHKDKADPKQGVRVMRNGNSKDQCLTRPYAQEYEDLLEEDPDVVLESRYFKGIF